MATSRSRSGLGALARRGLLAGLLLPGLLLVNLLCFCNGAAAGVAHAEKAVAGHCHAQHEAGADATRGAGAPPPRHEGGSCPHCGEGSALYASPRGVSEVSLPGGVALAIALVPPVATPAAVETAISIADPGHSPPLLATRNRILRI